SLSLLHTCPPRRSSDLISLASSTCARALMVSRIPRATEIVPTYANALGLWSNGAGLSTGGNSLSNGKLRISAVFVEGNRDAIVRSEEHTSELQSRENLV